MVNHIGRHLDLPVEAIDPFVSSAPISADLSVPASQSDRLDFVPAVGMALSDTAITPNFIFTYKDKEKVLLNVRIKRSIFGTFLIFMALCLGFYLWQNQKLEQKKSTVAQLEHQVEQYSPIVDQNLIVNMVTQTQRNIDTAKKFVQKYWTVGLITEISQKTPSNIKLVAMNAELGGPEGFDPAEKNSSGRQKILVIDGIVYGERLTFDSLLSGYIVKLKSSPMFIDAVVKKKSYEYFENQEVLSFTAQLKML